MLLLQAYASMKFTMLGCLQELSVNISILVDRLILGSGGSGVSLLSDFCPIVLGSDNALFFFFRFMSFIATCVLL